MTEDDRGTSICYPHSCRSEQNERPKVIKETFSKVHRKKSTENDKSNQKILREEALTKMKINGLKTSAVKLKG